MARPTSRRADSPKLAPSSRKGKAKESGVNKPPSAWPAADDDIWDAYR